ncbi:translation initiation factor IF-3 [Candidatus Latescibacterota bacterium]
MRVNEQIRTAEVRLIDKDGNQIGIVPIEEAMNHAGDAGFDLVEVSPNTAPPVCRIMDYGKYRYEITKRAKLTRKNRHIIHVKEIKMRCEISDHDFNFKINHAKEFFKRKDKVKFTIVFRGREILHKDHGKALLDRIIETLQDIAAIESEIRSEGRNLTMTMTAK